MTEQTKAMDSPWKALAPTDSHLEYLALLSYLPLKTHWAIFRFLRFTLQIQKQLRDTPGVLGYSLRAKPMSRNFWTLSVWEDEKALREFVVKLPHGDAMKALTPRMGPTAFTRWKVPGSAIPLRWEEAMQRSQGAQT
jgi:quinol monooxygenase YgiN